MSLSTVGDRLLVRTAQATARTTPSGLYIPETSDQSQIMSGEVTVVGPDVKTVRAGSKVWFNKFNGAEVKTDEGSLYSITEKDVFAFS